LALSTILKLFSALNCYEEEVQYLGESEIETFEHILSAQDCQILCQAEPTCTQFGYNDGWNKCFLNSGSIMKISKTGFISGPKFCPSGRNIIF